MIDRVYFGWDPGGLIRYLFSPGRFNEHERPRIVGAWDGRVEAWQPDRVGPGEFDFDLRPLILASQAPLKAARLPVSTPAPREENRSYFKVSPSGQWKLRVGTVRHLTVRNASDDRVLSDEEWGAIAEELVHRAGWSLRDDLNGPRWWAVRHDDDGIHVVAVMVRQDTQQRVWPRGDFAELRRACRDMENRYGLTLTASADGTAAVSPSAAEGRKADRQGGVPARVELRAAMAQAAARSYDLGGFVGALRRDGYLVEVVETATGPCGVKVARPGDVDRFGRPVFFGGRTLAQDLSLPKLLRRWSQARRGRSLQRSQDGVVVAGEVWVQRTVEVFERARGVLADNADRVDGIAHAVGEVTASLDRGEGRLLYGPADRWDRVMRAPGRPVPDTGRVAEEMRWLARELADSPGAGIPALVAALVALALQIASLLEDRGRPHQAWAARQTARMLSEQDSTRPGGPGSRAPMSTRRPGGRSTSPRRGAERPSTTHLTRQMPGGRPDGHGPDRRGR